MLNDRLKEARRKANLTQKQVAEMTGIATTTYSGYERGASDPDVNTLGKIMVALNTDANFLYQDYNQEETKKSPAPEGTEDDRISIEEMQTLLRALGFGDKAGNLSEKDVLFLSGVFDLLEAWFG